MMIVSRGRDVVFDSLRALLMGRCVNISSGKRD